MMTTDTLSKERSRRSCVLTVVINVGLILALACGMVEAANRVNIDIVKRNQNLPVDTLFADTAYELRVHVENDFNLGGMSLGFQVWSPDGANWQWNDVGGFATVYGGDIRCVTGKAGSRMMSGPGADGSCWDVGGFLVNEKNVDENGHDTILCGGVALSAGLSAGPLQHMYSYHFIPDVPDDRYYYTLCFDSCFVPPAGSFIFCDVSCDRVPTFTTPPCWVVTDAVMNNITCDRTFPVCPGGDAAFHAYIYDHNGDPVEGYSTVWVEFVGCDVSPCPGSPQGFDILQPTGPSDANGVVTFLMNGGGCDNDCYAVVKTPTKTIDSIPVRAFDINGDYVVSMTSDWNPSAGPCNDYNGNGISGDFNDDNMFQAHVGHSCQLDPCDKFGYRFVLDPESNLAPGQQISLKLTLSNNNVADSCQIGIIGFYASPFGGGGDMQLIENVPFNSTLAPGAQTLITVPYTIPALGHGCVHAMFSTDCCSTSVALTKCFQSIQHCRPDSNVCYQMNIELDQLPVYDVVQRQFLPTGWTMYPIHSPTFPLYVPDSISYLICTPNLSNLGDSASIVTSACYNQACTDFQRFENRVVITSQSGDANADCYVNLADAVYLINYVFKGGPAPTPLESGDPNCDGGVDLGDAVYLINYIFKNGNPPCLVE